MTLALLSVASILAAPLPESGKDGTVSYVFEARVKDNNGFLAFPLASPIQGEFTVDKTALKGATTGKQLRSPRNAILFRTPLGEFRSTASTDFDFIATEAMDGLDATERFVIITNAVSLPKEWEMAKPRNEGDLTYSLMLYNHGTLGGLQSLDRLDLTKFSTRTVRLSFKSLSWPGGPRVVGQTYIDAELTSLRPLATKAASERDSGKPSPNRP